MKPISRKRFQEIKIFILFFILPFTANAAIVGPINVCNSHTYTYSTTVATATYYNWTATGGTIASNGTSSVSITWGTGTSGSITVAAYHNTTLLSTQTLNVTIYGIPSPFITADFNSSCVKYVKENRDEILIITDNTCFTACDSSWVTYSTPLHSGSIYNWIVTGAMTVIPNGNSVAVQWGVPGMASIMVTETNLGGCSADIQNCVVIIARPHADFTTLPIPDAQNIMNVCLGQTAFFFDASTYDPLSPIISWLWNFGDGTFSSLQNPEHSWSVPGDYTIILTVTNECGCTSQVSVRVHVNDLPPVNIECPSSVCPGDTEMYSTDAICQVYNWSVTNGTIISAQPYSNYIQVVWGASGPGTLTLDPTTCVNVCPSPVSIVIPIISAGGIINGPMIVCENSQEFYTVPAVPGAVYNWYVTPVTATNAIYGQGTNSIAINWLYYSDAPPGGNAMLHVDYGSDLLGCSGTATKLVRIRPPFILNGPTEVCNGSTASVTASASPMLSSNFTWTIRRYPSGVIVYGPTAGTPTLPNIGIYFAGEYEITATASANAYCTPSRTWRYKIRNAAPTPGLIVGENRVCPNSVHNYSDLPDGPDYYLVWTVVGGLPATASGNQIGVTWNNTGPYSVSVQQVYGIDPSCPSSPSVLTVSSKLPQPPLHISGPSPVCPNQFPYPAYACSTATALYTEGDNYEWSINPQILGSVQTGQGTNTVGIQWNNAGGLAHITVAVTTCGGTPTTLDYWVTVGAINASITAPATGCFGDLISMSASPVGSYTYLWDFGDGTTSGSSTPSHTYSGPNSTTGLNTFSIGLTVTDPNTNCIGIATPHIIDLFYKPDVFITNSNSQPCYDFSTGVSTTLTAVASPVCAGCYTYQWYYNGNPVATTTAITINGSPYGNGDYECTVTNTTTGCERTGGPVHILGCGGCTIYSTATPPTMTVTQTSCTTYAVTLNYGSLPSNTPISVGTYPASSNTVTGSYPNYTVTFNTPGAYYIFADFTIGSPYCPIELSQYVVVPRFANFSAYIHCAAGGNGYDVTISDQTFFVPGYTTYNYAWTAVGPATYSGSTLPSTFNVPSAQGGTYIVTLHVTAANGMTICDVTRNVIIPQTPTVDFTWQTYPGHRCKNTPVLFTPTFTGSNLQWLWDFGDLSGSTLNPTYRVYATPQNPYTVNVTVTDAYGCTASNSHNITIDQNNLSGGIIPLNTPNLCPGSSVTLAFTPTSGSIISYTWNTGAAGSTLSASQTGEYNVTIESNIGCKYTTPNAEVIVHEIPFPAIRCETDYCEGDVVYVNGNEGASFTYQWKLDGVIQSTALPFLNYSSLTAGTHIFTLTISDGGSCSRTNTRSITVHPLPSIPIISGPTPACEGQPITLTASGSGTFNWSTGAVGQQIIVYNAGPYQVTLTDQYGCSAKSTEFHVTPLPDLNFFPIGCYEFCDTSTIILPGPGMNIQYDSWSLAISGSFQTTITGTSSAIPDFDLNNIIAGCIGCPIPPGVYFLTITITNNGCTAVSGTLQITIKGCDCRGKIDNIKLTCLMWGYNGQPAGYLAQVVATVPGATSGSYLITSPQGVFFPPNGTYTSTPVSYPSIGTGIFYDLPPADGVICVVMDVTDDNNPNASCMLEGCRAIDGMGCPPPRPCNFDIIISNIQCTGWDARQNGYYSYDLYIYNTGQTMNALLTSPQGTLNPTTISINPGPNYYTGIFYDVPPGNNILCITVSAYDPVTFQTCWQTACKGFKPCCPDCPIGRFAGGSTGVQPVLSVIPNPASTQVALFYQFSDGEQSQKRSIIISDMLGNSIREFVIENQAGQLTVDISELPPATYFVTARNTNGWRECKKLVVIR